MFAGVPYRLAPPLLHHDDEVREFSNDRDFMLSPLAVALGRGEEYGNTLVSMKADWNAVFAD